MPHVVLGLKDDNTATGFTTITPSNTANGDTYTSRIIYVSDTDGHDSNNGLSSVANPTNTGGAGAAGPKKTIPAGCALLQNGHPDWLLLKQGDTFVDQSFKNSGQFNDGIFQYGGRSADEPMVFWSYSTTGVDASHPRGTVEGARPIIKTSPSSTNNGAGSLYVCVLGNPTSTTSFDYIAVIGLEAYDYKRDPNNAAYDYTLVAGQFIYVSSDFNWLLVENCKSTYHGHFVILFAALSGSVDTYIGFQNVILRRNMSAYHNDPDQNGFGNGFVTQHTLNTTFDENNSFHDGWADRINSNMMRIDGTPSTGNTVALTFTNAGCTGFPITKTYTVVGGDTTVSIALGLRTLINADTTLNTAGLKATATTWSTSALLVKQNHSVSYNTACTASASGSLSVAFHSAAVSKPTNNLYARNPQYHSIYRHPSSTSEVCNMTGNMFVAGAADDRPAPSGGLFYNNLSSHAGMQMQPGRAPTSISYNVFLSGTGHDGIGAAAGPLSNLLAIYAFSSGTACTVSNNIAAHGGGTGSNYGITFDTPTTGYSGSGNITFDFTGPDVHSFLDQGTGNTVTCAFDIPNPATPDASWTSPNRTLMTYDTSLGGAGTVDNLMLNIINNQRAGNWNSAYTAQTINNYVRTGFNMANPGGGASYRARFSGSLAFRIHA